VAKSTAERPKEFLKKEKKLKRVDSLTVKIHEVTSLAFSGV